MYVTYREYQNLGYSLIPENEFSRYATMAEKSAGRFIPKNKKDKRGRIAVTKDNKRGLCEIADLYYGEKSQTNRKIAGFSNENYREQYFEGARLSIREQVREILGIYFTQEQLYRGV